MAQKNSPPHSESRQQIDEILEPEEKQTLIDVYLGKIGDLFTFLPGINQPPSYTFNAFLLNVLTLLISYLSSLIFKETEIFQENFRVEAAGVLFTFILLVGLKRIINLVTSFIDDYIKDLLEDQKYKDQLKEEIKSFFNISPAFYIGLIFFILRGIFSFYYEDLAPERGSLGIGGNILTTITFSQLAVIIYYFARLLTLILSFGNYPYNIYSIDPSTTELIQHIKSLTTRLTYIVSIIVVTATLVFWWTGVIIPLNALFIAVAGWIPLTSLFVSSFYVQRKIIANTKLVVLREIQDKITTLQSKDEIPTQETLERINKMIDFHDRVKGTPNSSLDILSVLNFFNSLFLPLLTSGIANYQELAKLWQKFFE